MPAIATKKPRTTGTTLNVADVKAALQAVKDAVPNRSPNPVLLNVLVADGTLTGFNGDVRITVPLAGSGDAPLLLPYARLLAILNASSSADVTFASSGTTCTVKSGTGTWTLPTEDAAEYPEWIVTGAKPLPKIPADQFLRAVNSVVSFADDTSSRFAMGGVLIEVNGDVVTFVATDGRRLATAEVEHDFAVDDSKTLVPVGVVKALSRLASHCSDDAYVQIEATANELLATVGESTVTARLLDGVFPNWQRVIPEEGSEPTTVTADELLAATRAAAICTSATSRGVVFSIAANGVTLHGQSAEAGESKASCPLVEFGEACTVKLDPAYVSEWLTGLPVDGEPTVSITTHGSDGAFVMRTDCHMGLIMPLES